MLAQTRDVDRSDEELLGRLQRGEPQAAKLLYDRHHRCLYAYALSLVRDPGLAEDVVHETFLKVLEARPEKPVASARAFLLTVARNVSLDLLRSAAREVAHRTSLARPSAAPPEPVEDRLVQAALAALHDLPQDQRETVTLKVFGRLTFAEIAEVMSVAVGTAASRYRYALEKLAEVLNSNEVDHDAR